MRNCASGSRRWSTRRNTRAGSAPSAIATVAATADKAEAARLRALARRITIVRDKWGIPHVYGKTDADAVFGLLYAQAEDDFNRIELNYINALGRPEGPLCGQPGVAETIAAGVCGRIELCTWSATMA